MNETFFGGLVLVGPFVSSGRNLLPSVDPCKSAPIQHRARAQAYAAAAAARLLRRRGGGK